MNTIEEIIQRKEQGIDCTNDEAEQIKEWLRELRMVGDQKIEAKIQAHFHLIYEEWLNEEDDWTKDYSIERDHESYTTDPE